MACAPSPYALRRMTMHIGTRRCAPATNNRLKCRTVALSSAAGPTMKPGVSQSETTGRPWASQSCRNLAALSAESASMAPPRWAGLLAMSPRGRPSILTSAVMIPLPNAARSSSTEEVSARAPTTARTSYTRLRSSGIRCLSSR